SLAGARASAYPPIGLPLARLNTVTDNPPPRRRSRMRWVLSWSWLRTKPLRALAALGAAYVLVVVVLLALEDRLVFRPSTPSDRWKEPSVSCTFQDKYLRTTGGKTIHARWFPCPDGRGAALFCHGQSAN